MANTDAGALPDQHLHIFNPASGPPETFTFFPRLPDEIHSLIWQQALSYERFIEVTFNRPKPSHEKPNHQGEEYKVVLACPKIISKLFRTTSESRHTALSFYRVQLPCRYFWNGKVKEDGTLYLCPELDIVKINLFPGGTRSTKYFTSVAQDIWTGDRRHVGLVNISLSELSYLVYGSLDLIQQSQSQLSKQVLSRLERVVFQHSVPRKFYPKFNSVSGIPDFEIHRCMPVSTSIPKFERLKTDPRSVEAELKKTYIGYCDPRRMFRVWSRTIARHGLELDKLNIKYSFLLSHNDRASRKIISREDASDWASKDCLEWKAILRGKRPEYGEQARDESPEELAAAPQMAIGFWHFPWECIGPFPSLDTIKGQEPNRFSYNRVLDFSERPPELWLSHLP